MDAAGERRALVLLDEAPIADVLQPPVGDRGRDLLHGVQAEIAAVGEDRGEQRAHFPGVDPLAWPLEVDAEPEVVLDIDEQVGEPGRATAGVQPAVQFDEAVRLRRVGVLGRVRLQPPPVVVEHDLPVVRDTLEEPVERIRQTCFQSWHRGSDGGGRRRGRRSARFCQEQTRAFWPNSSAAGNMTRSVFRICPIKHPKTTSMDRP